LREKLSENGYRLVLEKYTREVSVSLWDKAFKDILAAPLPVMPRLDRGIQDMDPRFRGDDKLKRGNDTMFRISNSGRLDRIFGVSISENIRELLGLRFEHKDAGGEWPHTYSEKAQDDKGFWELAQKLDKATELQKI
jgi:hypothetical protein